MSPVNSRFRVCIAVTGKDMLTTVRMRGFDCSGRHIGARRARERNFGISMCAVIISRAKIGTQFNLILREKRGERNRRGMMPQDPFIAFLLSAFIIGQSLAHLWFIPLSKYRW